MTQGRLRVPRGCGLYPVDLPDGAAAAPKANWPFERNNGDRAVARDFPLRAEQIARKVTIIRCEWAERAPSRRYGADAYRRHG